MRAGAHTALQFQFAHRESSSATLEPEDVTWDKDHITLRERVRKGHQRDFHMRIVQQPVSGVHPLLILLLDHLQDWQHQRRDRSYFFELPGESKKNWRPALGDQFLQLALKRTGINAPTGFKYTSHSVRKGAATAMHAIGVALSKICHFGGWAATSSAVHDYIDPAYPASPAARCFFGWLAPSS